MASIVSGIVSNVLSHVIIQEYELLGGLRQELQSIKDDFEHMMVFLQGADLLVEDHPEVRVWVAQVRDVAYDVEDALDEFVMQCTYRHSTKWYGPLRKMYTKSVGDIKARHKLATQIQNINKRTRKISESHERYKNQYQSQLPEHDLSPRRSYDKRGDALLLEEADLVGIEVPKKELTDLILEEDRQRNVISVVGMGGLGKTTLVKRVYEDVDVKSKFVHHVWVTVSESFNLKELFKNIIRDLCKEEGRQVPQELDGMGIDRLKREVKDILEPKKYIVVFDDVWQSIDWEAIHLAFPNNQFGSRIVITTRNLEVGDAASMTEAGGSVYPLSSLDNEKSMLLFCRKAFRGGISCPQHLEQICKNILGKCGGLPLAISIVGSSLARSQRMEDWESFYKRLGVEKEHNNSLDAMTKLLSLSYYNLQFHLKNCFLYLSIFPEDTKINANRLARLWVAEGFVETREGTTHEEVAKSYLNELFNRCLVQVVETNDEGDIKSIRVHDIIRHIILLKASEHNIITIFHGKERTAFGRNVRRLSVQGSFSDISERSRNHCKSIRTLFLCDDNISESVLSHLLSGSRKLLKVVDLKDSELEKFPKDIFKIYHLKYLSLKNTNVSVVPKSIGMLQSLQFLHLFGTDVTILPVEIQELQHLKQLFIGRQNPSPFVSRIEDVQGVRACFRVGSLKSLQVLLYIEADEVDNIRVVTDIGKLIHLRELGITKLKKEDGKELCSSLRHLKELRDLWVHAVNEEEVIDIQYLKPSDIPRLQRLILVGRLEICPELLSSLNGFTRIDLRHSKLRDDPLKYLHDLPNLVYLDLTDAYEGESLCFKAGEFPKLNKLCLALLEELRWVTVEENALPSLQLLWMRACQSMEEIPTGIEYFVQLQYLEFSNMSNEFVNKLENLDKQSAAYNRLLQIPQVDIATWTDGSWSEARRLNKETGTFNSTW